MCGKPAICTLIGWFKSSCPCTSLSVSVPTGTVILHIFLYCPLVVTTILIIYISIHPLLNWYWMMVCIHNNKPSYILSDTKGIFSNTGISIIITNKENYLSPFYPNSYIIFYFLPCKSSNPCDICDWAEKDSSKIYTFDFALGTLK